MNKFILPIIILMTAITSCDCFQLANGVVLDKDTKKPIQNVSLGRYETYDPANSFSRQVVTDEAGNFEYRSTSGGMGECDFDLYISKDGYEKVKVHFEQTSENDTIYLKKIDKP